jgi:SAM-dependent methyltransferase
MIEQTAMRPARTGPVIRALDAVGLLRPAYLLRRRLRLARFSTRGEAKAEGLPVPPARVRFYVGSNPDLDAFLEGGRKAAELIETRLGRIGMRVDTLSSLLDFGCGCGRVARHWATLEGPEIHGCDANPVLIDWCKRNLPFMTCVTNGLEPPLPYDDDSFDVVYAFSVLTHLPVAVQRAWIDEFLRIVRQDGALLVTAHGDRQASVLSDDDRRAFDAGQPVVLRASLAGTNGCSAFHPPRFVRESLLRDFDVVDFVTGEEAFGIGQDLYVGRPQAQGVGVQR